MVQFKMFYSRREKSKDTNEKDLDNTKLYSSKRNEPPDYESQLIFFLTKAVEF